MRTMNHVHLPDTATAVVVALLLGAVRVCSAADGAPPAAAAYPQMAPLAQYLMTREAEIALARSAAPPSISADATVLVLTAKGYETAAKGGGGFTCLVERSWVMSFDHPEFWNPKVRGPVCYNAAASRTVLLSRLYRTQLALEGLSKARMLEKVRAAVARSELPRPEEGAMSFMMSKQGYLADGAGPWYAHVMFSVEKTQAASWGANLAGSPVVYDTSATEVPEDETLFFVPVRRWSDGTLVSYPADSQTHSH